MRRFDPGYVRAKELIDAGELGRIEQFRAYSRDIYPPPLEFLLTAGGSFLDMADPRPGPRPVPRRRGRGGPRLGIVLFDERFAKANDFDTSVAVLRFRDGALGVVETSRHSAWGYDIRTEVAGAVGKVVVDGGQKTPATHLRGFARRGGPVRGLRRPIRGGLPPRARGVLRGPRRRPDAGRPDRTMRSRRCAWRSRATRSWREGRPVRLDEVTASA